MEFGHWDGLSFAEVAERHGDELTAWLGSLDVAPTGGESFRVVQERVLAGSTGCSPRTPARTVVVVSHVTPIKTLVAHALDAPLDAVFRMELSPASVTCSSLLRRRPRLDAASTTRSRPRATPSPPAPGSARRAGSDLR